MERQNRDGKEDILRRVSRPTEGGREGEGVGQTNDRSEGPIVGAVLEEIAKRHRWSRELVDEERLELSFQEMNHL
jgi:hypothetical protein